MKRLDLIGLRFGRLIVISYEGKGKWLCKCDCGNIKKYFTGNLTRSLSLSCGCYHAEKITTHKLYGSKTYATWRGIIQRCNNPNANGYNRYGGRGITICDRWLDFKLFLLDMGERLTGKSLDRIDNNSGYYKENCRWVTQSEQMQNCHNVNKYNTEFGEITLTEWAKHLGITKEALRSKLRRNGYFEKVKGATK